MSLIWLYILVNIVIDILQVMIMATDIDDSYIGLTFLAMGNSVSGRLLPTRKRVDIVAEVSISILGFTEMAMVGAFAGPIFLMLVGLPCAILPRVISKYRPSMCQTEIEGRWSSTSWICSTYRATRCSSW